MKLALTKKGKKFFELYSSDNTFKQKYDLADESEKKLLIAQFYLDILKNKKACKLSEIVAIFQKELS